jgi:hypothetical protein
MGEHMNTTVDFQTLIDDLRRCFANEECLENGPAQEVKDAIRSRMAGMLDAEADASFPEIIDRLADKWRRDGLIKNQ